MAPLILVSLAAASLLVVRLQDANAADSKNTAVSVDCVSQMNEPRTLIGFAPFTAETDAQKKLPINQEGNSLNETYVKAICDAVTTANDPTASKKSEPKRDGTFAYAPQSGEKSDCSAAVNYWKASGSSFGKTLPPAYKSDTEAPYNSPEARSFVALFNPGSNPTVDCAYITCTVTTTTTKAPTGTPNGNEQDTESQIGGQQSYSSLRLRKTNASNLGPAGVPAAGDAVAKAQLAEYAASEPTYENTKTKYAGITTGSPDTGVQQKSAEGGSAPSAALTVNEGTSSDGVPSDASFYAAYPPHSQDAEDAEADEESEQTKTHVSHSSSVVAGPSIVEGEDNAQNILRGAGSGSQAAPDTLQGAGDTTATPNNEEVGGLQTRRLQGKGDDEVTTVSGLVCVTYPKALVVNEAPFSQEQWDKISGASGSGSPSVAMAPLLAIAASAFGVFLL